MKESYQSSIMSSWEFVDKLKNSVPKYKRVLTNYEDYFSRDFPFEDNFNQNLNKIQTINTAMVEYFFDISGFRSADNPAVWFYEPNEKYSPNIIRPAQKFNNNIKVDKKKKNTFAEMVQKNNTLDLSDLSIEKNSKLFISIPTENINNNNNNINNENFHQEISWENLHSIIKNKKLQDRKITDFCGHFIYGEKNNTPGTCSRIDCNYIHSRDISKFQYYLNNKKVKSAECSNSSNCKYYVCLFNHPADNLLLFKSKFNSNTIIPITHCSEQRRALAAKIHKLNSFNNL